MIRLRTSALVLASLAMMSGVALAQRGGDSGGNGGGAGIGGGGGGQAGDGGGAGDSADVIRSVLANAAAPGRPNRVRIPRGRAGGTDLHGCSERLPMGNYSDAGQRGQLCHVD